MSDQEIEVKGLTTENATFLLAAAEELGHPADVVRVSEGRFYVPADVADKAGFDENGNPRTKATKEAAKANEEAEQTDFKDTTNPTQPDEAERAAAAEERNADAAKKAAPARKATAKKTAASADKE